MLTGPSVRLDPLTHAVRADLADIRLADRVFAPHYAAVTARRITAATPLKDSPRADANTIGDLPAGALFEVLELSARTAWGIAPSLRLVGYVEVGRVSLGPLP